MFKSIKAVLPEAAEEQFHPEDPQAYCQEAANYFTQKILDIRRDIDDEQPSPDLQEAPRMQNPSPSVPESSSTASRQTDGTMPAPPTFSTFKPVTKEEVRSIILSMGSASSCLDPLPTEVLKTILEELLPDITQLVNSSLATGTVPSAWKKAIVTPLIKKHGADPRDTKNLRPVSQLRLLPRITEAVVTKQMQHHLEQCHIFHDLQSGFRPGRGTELATADVREKLLWCTDNSHPAILILLDLSAAFDTVDHGILLNRLQGVGGFSGKALDWLRSFLTGRTQRVRWEEALSTEAEISCGVPQGSSLSPILFNVYLRPLATLLESTGLHFQMYADDTQILVDLHETAGESERLVPCLSLLREWMRQNKLRLNETKTELLAVGGDRTGAFPAFPWPASWGPPPTPSLRIRDLGVEISHHLDGSAQASNIIRLCHHQLTTLARIFPLLTLGQKKQLYQAVIGSRISYGIVFLLGATQKTIFSVQKIQNRAIRLIFALDRRQHVSSWRFQLGWLTIEAQITARICQWLWKARRQQGPLYAQSWARNHPTERARRIQHGHLLPVTKFKKSSKGGVTITCKGSRLWNSLPLQLRALDSFQLFKSELKLHLLRTEAKQKGIPIPSNQDSLHVPVSILRNEDVVLPSPALSTSRTREEDLGKQPQRPAYSAPFANGCFNATAVNRWPNGISSPPLPQRNNLFLLHLAKRNKEKNRTALGAYAPRTIRN